MYRPRLAKHRPKFDPKFFDNPVNQPLPLPTEDFTPPSNKPRITRNQRRLLRYQEIRKIMNEHLSDPTFSLHRVAEEIGISDRQVQRIFTSQGTSGFRQELTRMRISRACYLLKNTSLPITQISGLVGYKQAMHFAKAFRREMNASPRQWRKANQPQTMVAS